MYVKTNADKRRLMHQSLIFKLQYSNFDISISKLPNEILRMLMKKKEYLADYSLSFVSGDGTIPVGFLC